MSFVFVHGGGHTGALWGPVLPHLERPGFAADLPGRGSNPSARTDLTIQDCVDSVVADIDRLGWNRVVLVGHSCAGVVLPGVATKLPDRIAHLVFLSAAIPPEGKSIIDAIPQPIRSFVRYQLSRRFPPRAGRRASRYLFCNDMDAAQTEFVLDGLCPEQAMAQMTEPVSRAALPAHIPRTYIMQLRDHGVRVRTQRRQIANLGPCAVLALDSGHDSFVSQPENLARLLNGIAALSL